MTINVFEGARRISKIVAVLFVGGAVFSLFTSEPYISVIYYIEQPDARWIRGGRDNCQAEDESEWVTVRTMNGNDAHVHLCFKAMQFDDGSMLIPFRVDPKTGHLFGNKRFSNEVEKYTARVKESFRLTQEDEQWVDKQWWPERWKQIREGVLWLIGGLASLWIFTWTTGWIVRGFLGIPRGQDRRAE